MVARYILLKLKTLNSRHFKYISHQLVFYITAITTDNLKMFGYVRVTCIQSTYLYLIYEKKEKSPFQVPV